MIVILGFFQDHFYFLLGNWKKCSSLKTLHWRAMVDKNDGAVKAIKNISLGITLIIVIVFNNSYYCLSSLTVYIKLHCTDGATELN